MHWIDEKLIKKYNSFAKSKYYTKNKDDAYVIFIKITSITEQDNNLNLPIFKDKVYLILMYNFEQLINLGIVKFN